MDWFFPTLALCVVVLFAVGILSICRQVEKMAEDTVYRKVGKKWTKVRL